jgi:pimeloyl-ACP methyl ester carboxylesterase
MIRRLAALAAIAALLVTACNRSSTSTAKASPSPSISSTGVAWKDCGSGFQCGTLQVPLDYAHPDAGTIGIAMVRLPATDTASRIGSLLINPGGPGASGIDFIRGSAVGFVSLNRRFDLVSFDPRGVGQSAPVRCLTGPQEDALDALDGVLDDPQEKQAAIQANRDFVAGCQQRSARVLPFVDTVSAAKDMDLMRAALGDAKITYLGFSYGTFLGETYANLFPTHIRALALDSVVDPSLSFQDSLLTYVAGFEANLQAFLSDCVARKSATPPCKYAQSGDPGQKLTALMQRLDTNPLRVGNRMLTRALAVTGLQWRVFYLQTWPLLESALAQVDQGDGSGLLAAADELNGRNPDGTYSNEVDANVAINCLDRPVPTDISVYDQLGPAFAKASPIFGPAFQYSYLACADWPAKPTGHPGPLTAVGAPPILLIGGTNDPATPYAEAQAVHQQLAGSVLLSRQGSGHISYDTSLCATIAEINYLNDLTLPAEGTVCTT